ncbi:MAG: hypothetical protein IKV43_03315 [Clostridia bacterium]|nr:hypothetical protein [Clostridia bacterium]
MVTHLTFEELLEFNSMTLTEMKTGDLASRVTSHIRSCKQCRDALTCMQRAEDKIAASATKKTCVKTEGQKERLF